MFDKLSDITETDIKRLQCNLKNLLSIGDWTEDELADSIGLTKQTIWNLENEKSSMTKLQYIGINHFFNDKLAEDDSNKLFSDAMALVFPLTNDEEAQKNDPKAVQEALEAISATSKTTMSSSTLSTVTKAILASLGVAIPLGGYAIWKLTHNKK